jgi:hypothetical protein
MVKPSAKQISALILNIVPTTALFAVLWFLWATTPFPGLTVREMVCLGAIGAFATGALCRLWIRRLVIVCVASAAGFLAGGTWGEVRYSDVTPQISYEAWESLQTYWVIDLVLFCSVVVSWLITNYFVKRRMRSHAALHRD